MTQSAQSKCPRIGGCLKERTKDWAHPQECICEIIAKLNQEDHERSNRDARTRHLSDVEMVNQHVGTLRTKPIQAQTERRT
jgi:hypothetical protein